MNKQSFNTSFMFLLRVFLILSYSTAARHLLPEKQGEKDVKAYGIADATISKGIKEDLLNLMGSDKCDEKEMEEDCLKRRMIAEAHLDYIYTQHLKP